MRLFHLSAVCALALAACFVQAPPPAQPTAQPTAQPRPPTAPEPTQPPSATEQPAEPAPPACALAAQLPNKCADGDAQCRATADRYNSEGKDLWLKAKDLKAAQDKFLMAFGMTGEARYGFNWCYALHQLDDMVCAKYACNAVLAANPDEKMRKRTQIVLDDIAKRMPQ